VTGKRVAFDDCRESDGTMIEAKGSRPRDRAMRINWRTISWDQTFVRIGSSRPRGRCKQAEAAPSNGISRRMQRRIGRVSFSTKVTI
jgi:hypothetical protein